MCHDSRWWKRKPKDQRMGLIGTRRQLPAWNIFLEHTYKHVESYWVVYALTRYYCEQAYYSPWRECFASIKALGGIGFAIISKLSCSNHSRSDSIVFLTNSREMDDQTRLWSPPPPHLTECRLFLTLVFLLVSVLFMDHAFTSFSPLQQALSNYRSRSHTSISACSCFLRRPASSSRAFG
jgi:hypothetical protein